MKAGRLFAERSNHLWGLGHRGLSRTPVFARIIPHLLAGELASFRFGHAFSFVFLCQFI
jgi:hypothetical protein